ncbi:class I SAM-dependent methyltransferase [Streptosporangium lutulentum]
MTTPDPAQRHSSARLGWRESNRAWWDERVPLHASGELFDVSGFQDGRDTLRPFEASEVGDVTGKTLLHLQCGIGLDTLSWARRGARVTGLDFSEPAVEKARTLAAGIGVADARFVAADVYDAERVLGEDVRHRLHRDRRPVLAPGSRPVGADRGLAGGARRFPLPRRTSPDRGRPGQGRPDGHARLLPARGHRGRRTGQLRRPGRADHGQPQRAVAARTR